jgi:hypothetical protein
MNMRHRRARLKQRKLTQGILIIGGLLVVVGFLALFLYLR